MENEQVINKSLEVNSRKTEISFYIAGAPWIILVASIIISGKPELPHPMTELFSITEISALAYVLYCSAREKGAKTLAEDITENNSNPEK